MSHLSTIEDIIKDAKSGKMFILVDDENRENEGDLVIPARMADAGAVNFMAKYGRGLICLAMTKERIAELGLPPMARHNNSRHSTAFTVSIEAREGVTTGISASDRATTIAVAIDQTKNANDIATPGHVFPLEARQGGVLVRAGHTEAAVDISKLAGLESAGVICEIMNDDGTMARMPDLIKFAQLHNLKIATIADLIEYRRRKEILVECLEKADFFSEFAGQFTKHIYRSKIDSSTHIALVKGEITPSKAMPVRMHTFNILDDVLGSTENNRAGLLQKAMQKIANYNSGVIVLLCSEMQPQHANIEKLNKIRDYGIGAQILLDLGVKHMHLLTSSKYSVIGLEGYGLVIDEVEGV